MTVCRERFKLSLIGALKLTTGDAAYVSTLIHNSNAKVGVGANITPEIAGYADQLAYHGFLTEGKLYSGSLLVSHTLEYAGVVYDYDDVDQYLTIVERGGAFTDNFRSELLYVVSLLSPAELKGSLALATLMRLFSSLDLTATLRTNIP